MHEAVFRARLMEAIQDGLPLTPRPYRTLARALGIGEDEVLNAVRAMKEEGIIKRMGLVVKHRSLGYRANAMVVWDVPDEQVDELGRKLKAEQPVTLCYRRPRVRPDWPYNLFCMIHGRSRGKVMASLEALVETHALQDLDRDVLFSTHCFKQRGGRYARRGPEPKQEVEHG